MNNKSHLLYSKAPEGTETFKYSKRSNSNDKERDEERQATQKIDFDPIVEQFEYEIQQRRASRNPKIVIPHEIVCVEICFWSWFNSSKFDIAYRQDFGLTPLKFSQYNQKVLFAVVDDKLFRNFLTQVKRASDSVSNGIINNNILFIRDFELHSSDKIIKNYNPDNQIVYLNILENIELHKITLDSIRYLQDYLNENNITSNFNPDTNQLELPSISDSVLKDIADNFDVVHSINSVSYTITRPSTYGTNLKELFFQVKVPEDDLPIIGIIDTGVSIETSLKPIVINVDNALGLNGMNPKIDEADKGYGHGTSVAALAALGGQLAGKIESVLVPNAKILSIKVLKDFSGNIRNSDIADLIVKAHEDYGVKIFNLSICYSDHLKTGEPHSEYAFMLDKLAYELDILIFICTANAELDHATIGDEYPKNFLNEESNFCTPADSMNNVTVGALGDNLETELEITRSKYPLSSSLHPAAYTRKYNLDHENLKLKNRNVMKPDVIYSGGNYTCLVDDFGLMLDSTFEAGLQILSAKISEPVLRGVGTSFSTPLVANMAARLAQIYPTIKPQTIKALILNSAQSIKFGSTFRNLKPYQQKHLVGHGKPDLNTLLVSSENEVSIIFEDSIEEGTVKSLPLVFPSYLNTFASNTILFVEATLCYRFLPVANNQLAYCPVNIAFGFFNNIPLLDDEKTMVNGKRKTLYHGISGGPKTEVAFTDFVWSQDAPGRSKMLSNTQKVSFKIKRDRLIDEFNIIKVGVQCHFHKILPEYITAELPSEYEYSIVIKISESSSMDDRSNRLYDELKNLNDLQVLNGIELENAEDLIAEV